MTPAENMTDEQFERLTSIRVTPKASTHRSAGAPCREQMVKMSVIAAVLIAGAFAQTAGSPAPTFTRDIAPILQARCEECHRKGSMAPMPLVTYEETRPWAKSIRERVITRQMPPWHIDRSVGVRKFKNDMSL